MIYNLESIDLSSKFEHFKSYNFMLNNVITLALGSRPRQRGYKVASQEEARESRQEEARESHHILLGV